MYSPTKICFIEYFGGASMLKIKEQLKYKKGGTSRNCGGCDHFVRNFQVMSCDGNPLHIEPRCKVIGLENSIKYRVHEKNVCDKYCNEEGLRRLIGDKAFVKMKETSHDAA